MEHYDNDVAMIVQQIICVHVLWGHFFFKLFFLLTTSKIMI